MVGKGTVVEKVGCGEVGGMGGETEVGEMGRGGFCDHFLQIVLCVFPGMGNVG